MPHSYEEIRSVVIDILAGREPRQKPDQFGSLLNSVGAVIEQRKAQPLDHSRARTRQFSPGTCTLDAEDRELVREVFWDFFRQGLITLGINDSNREYPWFKVSTSGRRILENQETYFFHDLSTYEKLIRDKIPTIDDVTVIYLKEAMQAYRIGCLLSSSVMLGVATEHTFNLLIEVIEANPTHQPTYKNVNKERGILRRVNKFKSILDKHVKTMDPRVREDLDTHFAGILSIIRNFRNQSGHPSGHIIEREQCYVLLQLFIPYGKKMYQLMDHFKHI